MGKSHTSRNFRNCDSWSILYEIPYKIDRVSTFIAENAQSGQISQMSKLSELRYVIDFIRKSLYKIDRVFKFLAEYQILSRIMKIYCFGYKIDGIHSRQEKLIWLLLVELRMICDFVTVWWLLSGSGRAARHDNIIWTVIVSLNRTFVLYLLHELLYQLNENSRQPVAAALM